MCGSADVQIFELDFLADAEYPDPPNFCRRRKSAGKIAATVEPPQNFG